MVYRCGRSDRMAPRPMRSLIPVSVALGLIPAILSSAFMAGCGITRGSVGANAAGVPVVSSSFTSAAPAFSPAPGAYSSAQTVALSDATSGAVLYYTTDGTTPTTSSNRYNGPIMVSSATTIRAIAAASGYANSAVANGTYTIDTSVSVPSSASTQTVTISDETSGAVIYYTTDGSTPNTSSRRYTGPITVSNTETVKAIAIATGYAASQVGIYNADGSVGLNTSGQSSKP